MAGSDLGDTANVQNGTDGVFMPAYVGQGRVDL